MKANEKQTLEEDKKRWIMLSNSAKRSNVIKIEKPKILYYHSTIGQNLDIMHSLGCFYGFLKEKCRLERKKDEKLKVRFGGKSEKE